MTAERPLVGIVLVSHSATLAAGLAELLAELGGGAVPIATAGGAPHGGLGTDPSRVEAALGEAESGAGVVVIPDLGSAVLTVKTVLADHGGDAELVDAPFVEGAVSAVVTAAAGAPLAEVADSARQAAGIPKL